MFIDNLGNPVNLHRIFDTAEPKTIAIVGNGTSGFLANVSGPKIDDCDIVIRLNRCKIAGFEHLVGSKTTHFFIGGIGAPNSNPIVSTKNIINIAFNHHKYWIKKKNKMDLDRFVYIKDKTFQEHFNSILTEKYQQTCMSTGIYIILLMLGIYHDTSTKINIIGFDSHDSYKDGIERYYFGDETFNDEKKAHNLYSLHNFGFQAQLINMLVKDKLIYRL